MTRIPTSESATRSRLAIPRDFSPSILTQVGDDMIFYGYWWFVKCKSGEQTVLFNLFLSNERVYAFCRKKRLSYHQNWLDRKSYVIMFLQSYMMKVDIFFVIILNLQKVSNKEEGFTDILIGIFWKFLHIVVWKLQFWCAGLAKKNVSINWKNLVIWFLPILCRNPSRNSLLYRLIS